MSTMLEHDHTGQEHRDAGPAPAQRRDAAIAAIGGRARSGSIAWLLLGALATCCLILAAAPHAARAVDVFTLDSAADGHAEVAVDATGSGYFAWEHKTAAGSDQTWFCKVPRGGTCAAPIVLATPPLNPPPFDSTDVSAAFPVLGPGSTVYVVGPRYVAADVVVWTSTDGGATFGPAVQVTQSGAYGNSNPTNVLLGGGGFYVSSHNPGLSVISARGASTATGADLTPAGGLTNITGSALGLAGASGSPVVAFSMANGGQPQTVEFRSYLGAGDPNDPATWSAPAVVGAGTMPSLAGGPKGLFLLSQDAVGNTGNYAPVTVRSYAPGSGFGAPVSLQSDTTNNDVGRIFQTPGTGQLIVAWEGTTRSDGGTAIRLYRSSDGGATFTGVGDVAEGTPNWAFDPDSLRLAAADDGQGFLTFFEGGGGQSLLRVADLNPITTLTLANHSVKGSTITAKLTFGTSGKLVVATRIHNTAALASAAKAGCRKGQVLLRTKHGHKCVSSSFGAKTVSIPAAGTYTIRVSANAAARRALRRGKTLRVSEKLTFTPTGAQKATIKTFNAKVRGSRHHKKH